MEMCVGLGARGAGHCEVRLGSPAPRHQGRVVRALQPLGVSVSPSWAGSCRQNQDGGSVEHPWLPETPPASHPRGRNNPRAPCYEFLPLILWELEHTHPLRNTFPSSGGRCCKSAKYYEHYCFSCCAPFRCPGSEM